MRPLPLAQLPSLQKKPGFQGSGPALLAYLPQLLIWTLPSTASYASMQPHTWSGAFQCAQCLPYPAPLL